MKENIKFNDFNLFFDIVRALTKMSDGVKMSINQNGLIIYAKNDYSKCEMTSNSVTSQNQIDFCVGDLGMLLKILTTLKGLYTENEINTAVKMYYDAPFIKIESRKFKTKISTVSEDKILNFIGTKVHTALSNQIVFTTNSDIIKSVNSHSFIFNDSTSARIYLMTDSEMENNVIFAKIGNEGNDLANSVTLEMGLINEGVMDDRKIILDFNRLNVLNIVPSNDIKVSIAKERPVLMSNIKKEGKNGTFFNLNLFVFMMVK